MGGPTVKGIENPPNIKPIAWDASKGPTMSNAIGPSKHTNIPSQIPKMRQIAINPSKLAEKGMHAVTTPITTNAVCCM
jgi:hypothetical protein